MGLKLKESFNKLEILLCLDLEPCIGSGHLELLSSQPGISSLILPKAGWQLFIGSSKTRQFGSNNQISFLLKH